MAVILSKEFKAGLSDAMNSIFSDNLAFSFIFGSFAKGYASQAHDLDIFICLYNQDLRATEEFFLWNKAVHEDLGLKFDEEYPGEIVTIGTLDSMIKLLPELDLTLGENSHEVFDHVVWTQVLSDTKEFISGNEQLLKHYEDQCLQYPHQWKRKIMNMLEEQDPLFFFRKLLTYKSSNLKKPIP